MNEEEKRLALAFLSDPQLLDRIASGIEALGYVGEDTNKKIGYLVSISRKLDAALSMVILSTSGSGKSGLAEALEAITPEEDLLAISRLSPQALYYMPKDALRRKFVSIEERAGSMEADYSIRSLQSKKKLTLAVPIKDPSTGRIETKVFEIFGPAAFLETTTESVINVETRPAASRSTSTKAPGRPGAFRTRRGGRRPSRDSARGRLVTISSPSTRTPSAS